MKIRKATCSDLEQALAVYAYARKVMRENGNPHQWGEQKPGKETVLTDIRQGNLYIIEQENEIMGVFALIAGEDPTYRQIEGAWKNDLPYGTIHRLASSGRGKGILKSCVSYCLSVIPNLRIDTHADNRIMQHLLEKNGFERCGIIYIEDKSPRIAYQYTVYPASLTDPK